MNLLVFASAGALPQTAAAPSFEVASIKRSAMTAGSWFRFLPGGRLSATSWIKQVVEVAYGVKDYQVTGGPGWLTSDRYDIEAKAANPGAGENEMSEMLQSLLADRFQLRLRRETRDFPVYALVVDKNGARVRALKEGEASRCGPDNSFACGLTSVRQLAKRLEHITGRPILDRTGLDGRYDLLLDFDTGQGRDAGADSDKPSLAKALQEQLGLWLEAQKAQFPVLVIEDIQRPTEN